jgi:hypothetical protein
MSSTSRSLGLLALALSAACASSGVRATPSPTADVPLRTFRIAPAPPSYGIANTPTLSQRSYRALSDEVAQRFRDAGFVPDAEHPDFEISFYVTAGQDVNVTEWNGNVAATTSDAVAAGRPRIARFMIDVIDPASHAVLWTGSAKLALTNDDVLNAAVFAKAGGLLSARFPTAGSVALASILAPNANAVSADK